MALSGVHILLSYACTYECDHCFLYCSPRAEGTFTLAQVRELLEQSVDARTVRSVYFEGGEPFLFHPLLVEGLREARARGFSTGVVTNCYWATTTEDGTLWLEPLAKAGLGDLSVSDDEFHHEKAQETPATRAVRAADRVGLAASSICIEQPLVEEPQAGKGDPVVGGGVLFKGRAADTMTEGLPTRSRESMTSCPHEELVAPKRVHVDAYGNVHVCQGVCIGNVWETPLAQIMETYDAATHPVCGPLTRGGPRALAGEQGLELAGEFVDECHYCFALRRALLGRFPTALAPPQVYGVDTESSG